ncbi:unnamed protein product [Onchocerca flexuosa]|uniref:Secreted protein n=1 Tax=Onchocerca flexuosa TaxID=387005 RepID=A0A183H6M5_9BILA|nr:unnamed protein product [Onchocerca flexuosa]
MYLSVYLSVSSYTCLSNCLKVCLSSMCVSVVETSESNFIGSIHPAILNCTQQFHLQLLRQSV